jgi:hypothetical protein
MSLATVSGDFALLQAAMHRDAMAIADAMFNRMLISCYLICHNYSTYIGIEK